MSLQDIMGPTIEDPIRENKEHLHHDTPDHEEPEQKEKAPPLRSWRKKYRKLKVRFTRVMDESHVLFKEERRALALARRLQEENDQLMEMLLDFQSHNTADSNLKSLLESITVEQPLIPQPTTNGADSADQALDYDPDYLATILKMPHKQYELKDVTTATSDEYPIVESGPSDYLDPAYEEEYLTNMDQQLMDDDFFNDPNKPLEKPKSRVLPGDKELNNQNQDSVLSWLRRHHPETFIQEKDPGEPKAEKKPRGSNKRVSTAQNAKAEPKLDTKAEPKAAAIEVKPPEVKTEPEPEGGVEEEGAANAEGGDKWKGRKHRLTKDDEAYRPKGGSSRGSKRKREEPSDKTPGRGKRAKGQSQGATPS